MWKKINSEIDLPIAYKTGDYDGKLSDLVIVEDENGKQHLAQIQIGILDGSKFSDWIDNHGDILNSKIVKYCEIPE